MTRAQNLLEAIKFSSTKTASGDQRITYWAKLLASKYQLGKLNEYAITKDWSITGYTFGPIANQLGKGKWLHLVATVTNKGADRGAFTHYTVTDQKEKVIFNQDKFITDRTNVELAEVPLEVTGARHIIALAVGQGETNGATVLGKIKLTDVKKNFDINKRFEMVAQLVRVVASKQLPGMLITGTGGLGKTYTVMQVLNMMGLVEDEDYFLVKGAKLTPIAFYELVHEHQDKLIILDDSDTILGNGDVRNMLKAALDTSGVRTMTYMSPAVEAKGLPTKFDFVGQLIVISNKKITDFDQPFISRVVPVDVTMTREEVLDRMSYIVAKGVPKDVNCDPEDMQAAFKLLKDFVLSQGDSEDLRPKDLNMRTVIKLAILHKSLGDAFNDVATYQLLNS